MKIIFRISSLLIILLSTNLIYSQVPQWTWANKTGARDMDLISTITLDDSGNVYSTGQFTNIVDFDPGPGTFNLESNGDFDIFITKISSAGNLIWAKSIGDIGFDAGYSIKLDFEKNVIITGFFMNDPDFDPDTGLHIMLSAGYNDAFVLKLDNNGNFIWSVSMGGSGSDACMSLAIDDSNNVYSMGSYNVSGDFDPDPSSFYYLTSNGELEIYISKLDKDGKFVWAKSIGGTEDDQGYAITLDHSGNIYTTGYFEKTVDFDPGSDTFNITGGNLPDAFILKLDGAGNFLWAKSFTGIADNNANSIAIDNLNNVYTSGYFIGTVDYNPDTTIQYNLTSAGQYDIFFSKLDSAGNFIWAKSMGATDDDQGICIAIDDSANIYSCGIFYGATDLDPDPGSSFNATSAGGFDLYITKLDSVGNFRWALTAGGNNRDQVNSIVTDPRGNIYVGGYFYSDTIPLGSMTLYNSDSLSLNSDFFIGRLGSFTTGIEKIKLSAEFSVFPNPANHSFKIEFPSNMQNVKIEIYNVSGECLFIYNATNARFVEQRNIDLASGIYFLKINADGYTATKKIIIEN